MKSYAKIRHGFIGYVMLKDSRYVKINTAYPLCLIICKINGYFREINRND